MIRTPALTAEETHDLRALRARLLAWLRMDAFALWADVGRDDQYGGFFETIGLNGEPVIENKRVRVSARQVYCYAQAGRLNWSGDWRGAIDHGFTFLFGTGLRQDGFIRHLVTREGASVNEGPDLYDQAFVFLALAEAFRATGNEEYRFRARALLKSLRADFGHPEAGFFDAPNQRKMLRSNPHMHLFECALAWTSVDPDGPWRAMAAELASLCRRRFVRPSDGALLEYFDADWRAIDNGPAAIEPGHQFEWTWLLAKWEDLGGEACDDLYSRFYALAEAHGICGARGVGVDALTGALAWTGPQARLWPQTERLKSSLALAKRAQGAEREKLLDTAREAGVGLWKYFDGLRPGLWRDKMQGDGSFIQEAAPASSFYHIVCAISELEAFNLD
jgi:mannose-6-phosphate isomerase